MSPTVEQALDDMPQVFGAVAVVLCAIILISLVFSIMTGK